MNQRDGVLEDIGVLSKDDTLAISTNIQPSEHRDHGPRVIEAGNNAAQIGIGDGKALIGAGVGAMKSDFHLIH